MIITGAGSGLGRAYALQFARLGANVVVNDVNEKAAKAIVDEITKGGWASLRLVACLERLSTRTTAGGKAVAVGHST